MTRARVHELVDRIVRRCGGTAREAMHDRAAEHLTLAQLTDQLCELLVERPDESGAAPLTFAMLRSANLARLPEFKNAKGEPAHSEPDGSDWGLAQWSNAVLGELGEAANIIKKIERGDLTLDEARSKLADEFCDVVTYLDILAYRAGIDLAQATISKWNRVSERVGSAVRLAAEQSPRDPKPAPVAEDDGS